MKRTPGVHHNRLISTVMARLVMRVGAAGLPMTQRLNVSDSLHEPVLVCLTDYLTNGKNGRRPSYTGLLREIKEAGVDEHTIFQRAFTSTGESLEFIAKGLGQIEIAKKIEKQTHHFASWESAIVRAVVSDNMPAFKFMLRKRDLSQFKLRLTNAHDVATLALIMVSKLDKEDSRYTIEFVNHTAIVGGVLSLTQAMGFSQHLVRAMLHNGVAKPWRSLQIFEVHNPELVVNPEAWRAYETSCAHWTPARHYLFPRHIQRTIALIKSLAVAFYDAQTRSYACASILGTLPNELLYYLINVYLGLICA